MPLPGGFSQLKNEYVTSTLSSIDINACSGVCTCRPVPGKAGSSGSSQGSGHGSSGKTSYLGFVGRQRDLWRIYEAHIVVATLLCLSGRRAGRLGVEGNANLFYGKNDLFSKPSLLKCSQGWCLMLFLHPPYLLPLLSCFYPFAGLCAHAPHPAPSLSLSLLPLSLTSSFSLFLFVPGSTGGSCHRTSSCASGLCIHNWPQVPTCGQKFSPCPSFWVSISS